jgi:hypothetical protein
VWYVHNLSAYTGILIFWNYPHYSIRPGCNYLKSKHRLDSHEQTRRPPRTKTCEKVITVVLISRVNTSPHMLCWPQPIRCILFVTQFCFQVLILSRHVGLFSYYTVSLQRFSGAAAFPLDFLPRRDLFLSRGERAAATASLCDLAPRRGNRF